MIEVTDEKNKPSWVIYPIAYIELINNGKDEFLPWYLMDKDDVRIRFEGLQIRYPVRFLFPFARDDDSDDIACWEKDKPGKIIMIHDYASPGWENKKEFETFSEWYCYVLD